MKKTQITKGMNGNYFFKFNGFVICGFKSEIDCLFFSECYGYLYDYNKDELLKHYKKSTQEWILFCISNIKKFPESKENYLRILKIELATRKFIFKILKT